MNRARYKLVMFGVVTRFDVGLRIDMTVWRPVHESNREQIRFFLNQAELRAEDQLVRFETFEDSYLRPISQADLTLQFERIRNPLALRLKAERKVAGRLQFRGNDLAKPLGSRVRCQREGRK